MRDYEKEPLSEEERKQYADMEALCRLKDMEVGKPITQFHLDGVRHFFGPMLDKIKPMQSTVHFNDEGEPSHTTGADIFESVGGKKLEHRP